LFERDCTAGLIFARLQLSKKGIKKSALRENNVWTHAKRQRPIHIFAETILKIWAGSAPAAGFWFLTGDCTISE
jgi:hypothetical protein